MNICRALSSLILMIVFLFGSLTAYGSEHCSKLLKRLRGVYVLDSAAKSTRDGFYSDVAPYGLKIELVRNKKQKKLIEGVRVGAFFREGDFIDVPGYKAQDEWFYQRYIIGEEVDRAGLNPFNSNYRHTRVVTKTEADELVRTETDGPWFSSYRRETSFVLGPDGNSLKYSNQGKPGLLNNKDSKFYQFGAYKRQPFDLLGKFIVISSDMGGARATVRFQKIPSVFAKVAFAGLDTLAVYRVSVIEGDEAMKDFFKSYKNLVVQGLGENGPFFFGWYRSKLDYEMFQVQKQFYDGSIDVGAEGENGAEWQFIPEWR